MDTKFNGNRLKLARTYRGMTLAELGEKINLTKQTISLYENNKSFPDYSIILKFSRILHFPASFFYQEDEINVDSGSTYFRSLTSTSKKSRNAEITKVEFIGALYEILYHYIDFPSLNLPIVNISSNELQNDEIEMIANETRLWWGLEKGPIEDLQFILEENGIIVVGSKLKDEKIDAYSQMLSINGNETFLIVLSTGMRGRSRINFNLAHELGHIILHPWTEDIETISNEDFKEREKQANKFASSFLLPKETFELDVNKFPNDLDYYLKLKDKWGVSVQAMLYRSFDLGIISYNQFQYLMRQIGIKGWRKKSLEILLIA